MSETRGILRRGIVLLLLLSIAGRAGASIATDVRDDARETARTMPRAAWTLASAPFRARNLKTTVIAACALGALIALDQPIRRNVQLHLGTDNREDAHNFSTIMDTRHEVGAAVTLYGIGLFARLPGVRRAGLRTTEALAVNEALTVAIKGITGRERPYAAAGPTDFHPFGGAASFPSGHATAAFTVGTAIARSSGSRVVMVGCYGLAGSVGAARIIQDVHWTSDVVASTFLGYHVAEQFTPLTSPAPPPAPPIK